MNKRLFFSISLVLVLCLASSASAATLGLWKFDDSTADDTSGAGHHGTLESDLGSNPVTFVFDVERDSNVAAFPGDPNTMINCGGGKALSTDPCTWADIQGDQITMAAWIKHDGLFFTSYEYVLAKEDAYRVSRWSSTRYMRIYLNGLGGTLTADSSTIADDGEWHHFAGVSDGITVTVYWDGEISSTMAGGGSLKTTTTHNVTIGGHPGNSVRVWKGWLDDVRLYDNYFPQGVIRGWIEAYDAYNPVPEDGATKQEKALAQLSWTGMAPTSNYRVYLGTDFNDVNDGVAGVDKGEVATMSYSGAPMGALKLGTIYYWRVDSNRLNINHVGDIWQFETKPAWSENPWPIDTCKYVGLAQELSWSAGDGAIKSEVFFSDNEQWVIDACDSIRTTINAPDPCVYSPALVVDTTYYWKVDSDDGSVYTSGNVWSLSTDAPSPEPGMFGFWPMEDDDVATGTVTWDISGGEHHGTYVQGDPASSIDIVVDAERGNVLRVDNLASPAINSALDCGGGPDDIHDPCWGYVAQDQITVALWAKMEEGHTTDYIFTIGNTTQYCRAMGTDLDEIRLFNNNLSDTTIFGKTLWENAWHWVVLTYDNDVNERKVYVDGRIERIETTVDGPLGVHSDTVVIGGRLNAGYNYRGFDGWIDDVRVYDLVLPCWKIVAEGTQCATCVGDLDADGDVDLTDLNTLVGDLTSAKIASGQWLIIEGDAQTGVYWKNCSDMDADDDIDLADLNRMVGNLTWEEITTGTPGTWSYPCGKYCP